MALMTLRNISLSFGMAPILDRVNLTIEPGERVSLVGRNGAGKSSLMKIMAGQRPPDEGSVITDEDTVKAYLPQDVPTDLAGSIYEVVFAGLGDAGKLLARYERVSTLLALDQSEALMNELEALQERLDQTRSWDLQEQVDALLSRHNLERDAPFEALSGGMKRRVLLARALAARPDLLFLDEPTNHLDIEAIVWLEEMLKGFPGAVVFVTHDRMFLRRVATRIVDLDRGQLASFPGDLDLYHRRKQEALEAESAEWNRFDKKLAEEEIWIRQGIKARRTRNEGRVRALKKLRTERSERRERMGKAKLSLETAERSGREVVAVENLSFAWGEKSIVKGLKTTILRGDRVGLIGPNGCGKTTLLRLLLGDLEPLEGTVKLGTRRQILFFDQLRAQLDPTATVQDNVSDGNDTVQVGGKQRHVLGYLKDFLFSPLRARSPVSSLSGGERNRLLLAKLLTKPANILVLDEPTNDLDTETLELLELMLLEFSGTVLLVSHDREFINNVVTSTLVFDEDGAVRSYAGGYDDWLSQRAYTAPAGKISKHSVSADHRKTKKKPEKGAAQRRLTFREKQELETLPTEIENLEAELEKLNVVRGDPETYKRERAFVASLEAEVAECEDRLVSLYARWEALDAMAETP